MKNQLDNNTMPIPKRNKRTLHVVTLIFTILIFIVTSLIFAESLIVDLPSLKEYYQSDAISSDLQGNLGEYNIECVKNTLAEQADGTYTLTAEMAFTNYSSVGISFNDAVEVVAYQSDKELPMVAKIDISSDENADVSQADESSLNVRNSQSSKVILTYRVTDPDTNILIEMKSGSYSYTYTINLEG